MKKNKVSPRTEISTNQSNNETKPGSKFYEPIYISVIAILTECSEGYANEIISFHVQKFWTGIALILQGACGFGRFFISKKVQSSNTILPEPYATSF